MRKLALEKPAVMSIAIRQEIERSDESRYDHRLHRVLWVDNGQSGREVALLFGEEPPTVQRWVKRFENDGFDGLPDGERPGRPRSLDERQWVRLERDLRGNPRDFGHTQNLWDGNLLAEHRRPHYRGTRTRLWVPPEVKDPDLEHAPTRKSMACFGAVSLRTGKFIHAMNAVFDAHSFQGFLAKLLRHRTQGQRMVIILDNARYHHAKSLAPLLAKHRKGAEARIPATLKSPNSLRSSGLEADAKASHAQLPLPNLGHADRKR